VEKIKILNDGIKNCEYRKSQLNRGNVCGIVDSKCLGYYTKNLKSPLKECSNCGEFFKDFPYKE